MALASGWQGRFAVEDATEWFCLVLEELGVLMSTWAERAYLGSEVELNDVSRCSRDRVGCELEEVVLGNLDHHDGR